MTTKPPLKMALDRVEAGYVSPGGDISVKGSAALPAEVTSGMLYKDVVRIAWPSMVELALTQLASMVDMMMVGQLGAWALSAVGLTTQPKFLLMTLFMAMNVGATAMVARYKGAGQQEKANLILRQAMVMTLVLSLASSLAGYVFAEPLIRFMGAMDDQVLHAAVSYLRIQMVGFVFMALTSTATATLRGVGNSRTAMVYNLVANMANVILNYLLIYGHLGLPRMEVAGASLATVLGQGIAFVLAMHALMSGRSYIQMRLRESYRPDKEAILSITRIGVPAMIEQFVMRAGMIIYSKLVASLGNAPYATHQVCMNINAMSFMIGQAFAVSATSLVGQSLGKRRPDMAQFYATRTQRVGMAVSVLLGISFFVWGRQIVGLYTNEADIILQGGSIMRLVAFTLPLQSSQFILSGALRGAGDTRAVAVISFVTILLVRPTIAAAAIYLFHWGLWGAWIALLADQLLRSALVLFRYNSGKWKAAIA